MQNPTVKDLDARDTKRCKSEPHGRDKMKKVTCCLCNAKTRLGCCEKCANCDKYFHATCSYPKGIRFFDGYCSVECLKDLTGFRLRLFLVGVGKTYKDLGYDSYDSFVICCTSSKEARRTHPGSGLYEWWKESNYYSWDHSWVKPEQVDEIEVECLGFANEGIEHGIICNSFNAG